MVQRKMTKRAKKETAQFYLYISPWIIGFVLFTLIPLVASIYFSLYDFTKLDLALGNKLYYVGFDNFKDILFNNDVFYTAVGNTFFYSLVRVLVGCLISFLFATILNKKIWGRKLFRILIYIPAIIPIVGSAIVWKGLFDEQFSFFNFLLSIIGVAPVDWLGNNAMGSVLLMSIWCGIGPTMLIILAGLQSVSQDVIEASIIDGANAFQRYWHIVIPTISPTILYVLITGFIGTLQAYSEFDLITGGGPGYKTTTMSMLVIQSMNNEGLGYACAMAWIICFIVLIFTLIFFAVTKGKIYYREGD